MKTIVDIFSVENPVFTTFISWSSILVIKFMLMGPFTGFMRYKTKTFANYEDSRDRRKVRFNDESVERVRRAHRNDMENILPAIAIGFFYVLINPSQLAACLLFKIGALARILHTIVYAVFVIPQPSRALAFFVHYLITIYMATCVLIHLF